MCNKPTNSFNEDNKILIPNLDINQISIGSFHLQKFQISPNKTKSVSKKRKICYNQLIQGKEYTSLEKFLK